MCCRQRGLIAAFGCWGDSTALTILCALAAGTSQWPGANFILFPSGDKVFLKFGDRRRIASELKIGDIVERHLDREHQHSTACLPFELVLHLLRLPSLLCADTLAARPSTPIL